jgi:hypothetical protein
MGRYSTVVLSVLRAVFASADDAGQSIPCADDSALSVMQNSWESGLEVMNRQSTQLLRLYQPKDC